ncbi:MULTISPECIES: tautomerase PptA [Klebsiella]|jgi:4-oxalocrotonate tautomerase|uniref:tautomerase PptA n=1 Tax=Klebsiella TaxID=570 RepID=UPI0007CC953F|nr:tautomerase PptA [Klebsiella oxytoca]EKU6742314.1 tautomerase PptA [Klebsiella oxytoca]EKU7136032.1 tautomerase PptA [Klebsiella oxytoca]EKV0270927.1 tautomerase PptA [Klebsiella oxytoca]EKV1580873.1 tautomerase PptA [Klebsiella oxytoca]EKV9011197.1 tautomerase PptA [Klebsiella oxytoca]
MPHIDIKCFPRDLNDEQKAALAADITEVVIRHLNSKERSVSVALNEINESDWQQVWDSEIAPQMEQLIKKPGYSM